jgi:regulatory protein YycH of two-component signal transduction system YycFG
MTCILVYIRFLLLIKCVVSLSWLLTWIKWGVCNDLEYGDNSSSDDKFLLTKILMCIIINTDTHRMEYIDLIHAKSLAIQKFGFLLILTMN